MTNYGPPAPHSRAEEFAVWIDEHNRLARVCANRAAAVMDGFTGGYGDTAYISACAELGSSLTELANFHSDQAARLAAQSQRSEEFERSVDEEVARQLHAPRAAISTEGLTDMDRKKLESYARLLRMGPGDETSPDMLPEDEQS